MTSLDYHLHARTRGTGWMPYTESDWSDLDAFYDRHPELAPTPLRALPGLAARLGVRSVHVKDESSRFGLNAFKSLGVRYACDRLLRQGVIRAGATLVCASAGNHGRAVARAARALGLSARVYMAHDAAEAPARAIASEGAEVFRIAGSYDDAVRVMADEAERQGWTVVSDTSWDGYMEVPRLIALGYTRLVQEVAAELPKAPDVVFAQGGVGGLVCGVACGLARHYQDGVARLVVCEPEHAACLLASARAGHPVTVEGPLDTIMAGLRCASPSPGAWPPIAGRADAFVAIPDDDTVEAMRRLARPEPGDPAVEAGPSGACGVGALLALLRDPALAPLREHVGLTPASRVLAINSEGATDPELYRQLAGD